MHRTRARGPVDGVRVGPAALAARAGYDRWADPPLINNTLVALLHNPRPLVAFPGVHERDALSLLDQHTTSAVQSPSVTNKRAWWHNSRSGIINRIPTDIFASSEGFWAPVRILNAPTAVVWNVKCSLVKVYCNFRATLLPPSQDDEADAKIVSDVMTKRRHQTECHVPADSTC
jgi:hypothetical protein